MNVVVLEVLVEEAVELPPVPDQGLIQQLPAQGADPALGVGRPPRAAYGEAVARDRRGCSARHSTESAIAASALTIMARYRHRRSGRLSIRSRQRDTPHRRSVACGERDKSDDVQPEFLLVSNESFPIISVDDLDAVVAFYEQLGFSRAYVFPPDGPPAFVTLERGVSTIGISRRDDTNVDRFSYWVYVDDVDASFATARAEGAPVVTAPRTEPWGERVATVRDPDGNVVHLGAPTSPE
jgi:uncharacterized glyoxalase superfamily protein PhnB